MKAILKIKGLDCAECANELQEELEKIEGIKNPSVSFVMQKVSFEYETEEPLIKAIETINNFEEVRIVIDNDDEDSEEEDIRLLPIIISSIIFVVTFILTHVFKEGLLNILFSYIGYSVSYIIVGYKVIINTFKAIKKGKIFDENFLMTVASLGAIGLSIYNLVAGPKSNEMPEAALIILLYQIGEYLQGVAVKNSRKTIKGLLELKSDKANKLIDGNIVSVDPKELKVGDIIVILAGEKVPVDVKALEASEFDTKALTGEEMPRYIETNQEVLSGFINISNTIQAEVIKTYDNSAIKKILDLVENSAEKKAKPEKFITKFAKYYTPIVCTIALTIAISGPLFALILEKDVNISDWIIKALTVLVIACPCSVVISVPLTYFSGIGACAKKGILVKGANNLDELTKVKLALFDKTGTLTKGVFKIINKSSGDTKQMDLLVGSIEKYSNHPLSAPFNDFDSSLEIDSITETAGYGLSGKYQDKQLLVGNKRLLENNSIDFEYIKSSNTIIYVAYDNKYLGYYEVGDEAKDNINVLFRSLKKTGVNQMILLTGDSKDKADSFSSKYHFDAVFSELLPDKKLEITKDLTDNACCLYVGDGINDAPVMTISNCSFSMGKLGSDAAIEVSDFVLVTDDIMGVYEAKCIAHKTKKIVIENIVFSILIKAIVMILGGLGLVPLWAAVLSDVGLMLLAVLNSLRVKRG